MFNCSMVHIGISDSDYKAEKRRTSDLRACLNGLHTKRSHFHCKIIINASDNYSSVGEPVLWEKHDGPCCQ